MNKSISSGVDNRTWTCTSFHPLEPESSASANFAISTKPWSFFTKVHKYILIIINQFCKWFWEVGQRHLYSDEIILLKEILKVSYEDIFNLE